MPYIKTQKREFLDSQRVDEIALNCATPGELNYVITKIVLGYLENYGTNYTMINEVIGVLECAKQELYRVVAAPYEDKKIRQHGTVSGLQKS